MIIQKGKKVQKKIGIVIDYSMAFSVLVFCLATLLFAIPWIRKQRRIWKHCGKGTAKALILRIFNVEHVKNIGSVPFLAHTPLLSYRNSSIRWTGFFDPANDCKKKLKIAGDLEVITLKSPQIVQFLKRIKLEATSTTLREIIAVIRITRLCVRDQIGVLCAYKHDYCALRAYMVHRLIKIPYIVDIIANFELIHRLSGRRYYFQKLHKVPAMGVFSSALTNWLLGLPLQHAFHVFGRNKCLYEHAFALGAPVERLSLIRIRNFSAAFNSYDPKTPPSKPMDFPYILYVGRLAERKFPHDVLSAFDMAAHHLPGYHLVIIGDGEFRERLEEQKGCSAYKNRIRLLGECSNDVVLNWVVHAKMAVCPYSGSTLAEAMLCAIPVIAYDVASHPEIILDDFTGYLVPFRNIEALAEKMKYVARNYDEARIAGRRGRELASVLFDKEKICEKESIVYMEALSGTSSKWRINNSCSPRR